MVTCWTDTFREVQHADVYFEGRPWPAEQEERKTSSHASCRATGGETGRHGHRSVPDAVADHADATTPSLSELRQKYLSSKYGVADSARPPADADGGEHNPDSNLDDDDEIVTVEPTNATHPWDVTARPKVVVVSGREKRIVGRQG